MVCADHFLTHCSPPDLPKWVLMSRCLSSATVLRGTRQCAFRRNRMGFTLISHPLYRSVGLLLISYNPMSLLEDEASQHLAQLIGLTGQLFGRGSALFGTGGVLLGDLIDLA